MQRSCVTWRTEVGVTHVTARLRWKLLRSAGVYCHGVSWSLALHNLDTVLLSFLIY